MNNLYLSSLARQSRTNITSTNRGSRQRKSWLVDNRPSVLAQAKMVNSISCMQCELPEGASVKGTTAQVWLSKDVSKTDGILCNEIKDEEKKDTKSGALKKIAEKAAKIGEGIPARKFESGRWSANDNRWETGNYKDVSSKKFNPFQVPISSEYLTTRSRDTVKLIMRYHFGPYNNGYVIGVERKNTKDSSKKEPNTKFGTMSAESVLAEGEYSNRHVVRSVDNTILQDTKGLKGDENKRKLIYDEYTKLVGEGARFQCVRDNIDEVKDNTCFYTTDSSEPTNEVGILFSDLWGCWGPSFGQAFNISNEMLIATLRDTPQTIPIKDERIKRNGDIKDPKIELKK